MKTAVIGAGSIGLAAALVCQKAGHSVTLFDTQGFEQKCLSLEADPRVWALGSRSTQLLTELGAWAPDERLCAYQSMHVIDARSDARVTFTEAALGYLVEADWVRNQLLSRVAESGIDCVSERVESVSQRGVLMLPKNELDADLVIFAEGRQAHTALASGFEIVDGGYRQMAVVGTLRSEQPHHGEAFQIFTECGPLALLPLPDRGDGEHRVSLVWSLDLDTASELKEYSIEKLSLTITQTSESVRGALSFVDVPIWISLSQQSLKQDSLGCLLAIGDTAHGILPLAGLGANLGFADVLALQQTLVRAPSTRGDRIARTVSRERRFEQRTVAMVMGLFSNVFRSDQPLLQLGRSFAL
ncbi:MAG: FAD-dependent monooxygenase, partial [Pseudomonadota bacterium]|nr:FAD-dependent monooxygenase [Pseudomonadota bacterium]